MGRDRRPTALTAPTGGSTPPVSLDDEQGLSPVASAGDAIADRYVLDHVLGEGGMGVVWRATDRQLQRTVAVKMIRSSLSLDAALRLRREARTAAGLTHPNVVAIYDVGTWNDAPYIVMEFVDGVDLKQWLSEHPAASPKQILRLCIAAGRGLAAAHARGVVHRDFKPSNVLVDRNGRVRVADFGLARNPGGGDSGGEDVSSFPLGSNEMEATLTETGAVMGTPAYMAPEQVSAQPLTPSVDVYAFGLTLYEALYGRRPFTSQSFVDLHRDKLEGPPTPRPRDDVPERVHAAMLKAMQPSAKSRWPDMDTLLAELGAAQRSRRPLVAGALGLSAIVAGVALLVGLGDRKTSKCLQHASAAQDAWNEAPSGSDDFGDARRETALQAAQRWQAAYEALCRADAPAPQVRACLDEWLADYQRRLQQLHNTGVPAPGVGHRLVPPEQCTAEVLARRDPDPTDPDEAIVAAKLRMWAEQTLDNTLRDDPESAVITAKIDDAESIGHRPTLAKVLLAAASYEARASRNESALQYAERAMAVAAEGGAERDAVRSAVMAMTMSGKGRDLASTERWFRYIQSMVKRIPHGDALYRRAQGTLGSAYLTAMKVPEAIEAFEHTLAMEAGASETVDVSLRALNGLATAYVFADDVEQATEYGERAYALATRLGEADTEAILGARLNLAVAVLQQENYDQAEQLFAEISRRAAGNPKIGHDLRWFSELNRAVTIGRTTSRAREALVIVDQLEPQVVDVAGRDSVPFANVQVVRARLLHADGRSQEALQVVTGPLRLLERQLGELHPHSVSAREIYDLARGVQPTSPLSQPTE